MSNPPPPLRLLSELSAELPAERPERAALPAASTIVGKALWSVVFDAARLFLTSGEIIAKDEAVREAQAKAALDPPDGPPSLSL